MITGDDAGRTSDGDASGQNGPGEADGIEGGRKVDSSLSHGVPGATLDALCSIHLCNN